MINVSNDQPNSIAPEYKHDRVMDDTAFGRAALKKLGAVPQHFRIHKAGWLGDKPENWHGMQVEGAEFRVAASGPKKGKLAIKVPGTSRSTYVSRAEIEAERAIEERSNVCA